MIHKKYKVIPLIILVLLLLSLSANQSISIKELETDPSTPTPIVYADIIEQGIQIVKEQRGYNPYTTLHIPSKDLQTLVHWYQSHPQIEFASLIHSTITLKFTDGTYILLLDVLMDPPESSYIASEDLSQITDEQSTQKDNTALLLNAAESFYGNRYCKRIINRLLTKHYNIVYLADEAVNLHYIEKNLSAEIIYMNTHAGYWDIDGDQKAEAVVIGIGEHWTNETPEKYLFEYENKMIVQGMVGEQSFIAFTPMLIEYFYKPGDFPDSLVYMATCHATYDDSMAKVFLNASASAYMGWTRDTIFWTNSLTSGLAFRLFTRGFTVKQVCLVIRYGGLYNRLFRSRLTYYGEGSHRIPRS